MSLVINPIEFQRRVIDWVSISFVGTPIIEHDDDAEGDTLHFTIYCENKNGTRTCPIKKPDCFANARCILGPSVKVVFGKQIDVYANNPTEDQSLEILQSARKVALIISQTIWPLWLAQTIFVLMAISTVASLYFLHDHLHEYEIDGAFHTMLAAAWAFSSYYFRALCSLVGICAASAKT